MQALKVRKIGNSLGLVLPKEALAILNVKENDMLYITKSADHGFRITAYDKKFVDQMNEAEKIMQEDKNLLRELASR